MRQLIVEEWMSLDGYVTDQRGELEFFSKLTPHTNTYSDGDQLHFLERVDTILFGRKTYELFADFWPTVPTAQEVIADRLNKLPKWVFSNTLEEAPWGSWAPATIQRGAALPAIQQLKEKEGKALVLWGSISLVQELLQKGFVDELHLRLCPVTTGGGRRLFKEGLPAQDWEFVEVRPYPTGAVFLNYKKR